MMNIINKKVISLFLINLFIILFLFLLYNSHYNFNKTKNIKFITNITQNVNNAYENKNFFFKREINKLNLIYFDECFKKKFNYPYINNPFIYKKFKKFCINDMAFISGIMGTLSKKENFPADEDEITSQIFKKIQYELLSPNNIFRKNLFILKEYHVNPFFYNFLYTKGRENELRSIFENIVLNYKSEIYEATIQNCEFIQKLNYCTEDFKKFLNNFYDTFDLDYLIEYNFIKYEENNEFSFDKINAPNQKSLILTPLTFWVLIFLIFPLINFICIYVYKNYQIKKINN